MCNSCEDTFQYFKSMTCLLYQKPHLELDWREIVGDDPEQQHTIDLEVNRRNRLRKSK